MKLKMFAVAAGLAVGASTGAMAQYVCPPGYGFYGGVCQPVRAPGYSDPVAGAVTGEAAGAASGYALGGPLGAVVGGAIGTAAGTVGGAANMVTVPAACAFGYTYYNGVCYRAR